jgi:hypothetical protein
MAMTRGPGPLPAPCAADGDGADLLTEFEAQVIDDGDLTKPPIPTPLKPLDAAKREPKRSWQSID